MNQLEMINNQKRMALAVSHNDRPCRMVSVPNEERMKSIVDHYVRTLLLEQNTFTADNYLMDVHLAEREAVTNGCCRITIERPDAIATIEIKIQTAL
jgi:hypothetical protein